VTAANGTLNNLAKMLKTTPHQLEERAHVLLEQICYQSSLLSVNRGGNVSNEKV